MTGKFYGDRRNVASFQFCRNLFLPLNISVYQGLKLLATLGAGGRLSCLVIVSTVVPQPTAEIIL
jgi:hypothetical protein